MLDKKSPLHRLRAMNRLPLVRQVAIIGKLIEGNSLRDTSRLANVSLNTVTKLLVDLGASCAEYHHEQVRNVRIRRVQCYEIWTLVGERAKNVKPGRKIKGWGDIWTWVGLDVDTKLCVSYLVGGRNAWWARKFMNDCASRVQGRIETTTDGRRVYLDAAKDASDTEVEFEQLQKIYGASEEHDTHDSPEVFIGWDMKVANRRPDPKHMNASIAERQNLTTPIGMRRFTRLANGLSKRAEKHAAIVAIHFMFSNFARIHKSSKVTPAMAAGLADHVWNIEEIALLAN